MSKYMQVTVSIRPYYPKDMAETYPKLVHHLGYLDAGLTNSNPSLYALVGQFDQIVYRFEGTPLGGVLLRHREKLVKLYKDIQDNIANWGLAQADRLLYQMEDIFDQIESELE
jgi:hypothetical protein